MWGGGNGPGIRESNGQSPPGKMAKRFPTNNNVVGQQGLAGERYSVYLYPLQCKDLLLFLCKEREFHQWCDIKSSAPTKAKIVVLQHSCFITNHSNNFNMAQMTTSPKDLRSLYGHLGMMRCSPHAQRRPAAVVKTPSPGEWLPIGVLKNRKVQSS